MSYIFTAGIPANIIKEAIQEEMKLLKGTMKWFHVLLPRIQKLRNAKHMNVYIFEMLLC